MKFMRRELLRLEEPSAYSAGSKKWLQATERNLGGLVLDVSRNIVSAFDTHDRGYLESGGMTGGDRMYFHGYARHYAKYLKPRLSSPKNVKVVVEVGILKGTGLGIWSNLFPHARIIGLDIDLSHIKSNISQLKDRGAFSESDPEIYEFDQFVDNSFFWENILGGDMIDIMVDDGEHSTDAIMTTLNYVQPFLSENFLYFIEDNRKAHKVIQRNYPAWKVASFDQFTVVSQR